MFAYSRIRGTRRCLLTRELEELVDVCLLEELEELVDVLLTRELEELVDVLLTRELEDVCLLEELRNRRCFAYSRILRKKNRLGLKAGRFSYTQT